MPRRLVTSEIFRHDKVAELDFAGRLFFIGLITNADDEGRLKGSLKYLKANIFPYDDIPLERIAEYRAQCHKLGIARLYGTNGTETICLPGWKEHQSIRGDRIKPSTLPSPPEEANTTESIPDNHPSTTCQPTDNPLVAKCPPNISKDNIRQENISTGTSTARAREDEKFKQFVKLYGDNIGELNPIIAEQLGIVSDEFPVEWFQEAVKEACKLNARNLKYVTTILNRWKVEGFKAPRRKGVSGGTYQRDAGKLPTEYTRPEELRDQ